MAKLSNIVDYFKACYQEDFKAINILNFFGKKVDNQFIIDNAELLNGQLMQYPISTEWGKKMEEVLALHSTEKSLYCCAFFLSGKMNIIGKPQKVFAPLYIYPVTLLHEDGVYYVVIEFENAVINPVFVDFIKSQSKSINFTYDDLASALPKSYIRFDEMHQIETALQKLIPDLDISALDNFPELYNEAALKKIYNKRTKEDTLSLLPGVGFGFIQKPSGSRGILNELTQMSQYKEKEFSGVLKELFGFSKKADYKIKPRTIFTPVALSRNQMGIFDSCDNHNISLVVGPPGTGKSFTIAALAVDLISRGKSVLIASRNNQAGIVILNKIEKDFGLKGVAIKTSSKSYRTTLQKRLNNIFNGLEVQKIYDTDIGRLKAEILHYQTQINDLEKELLAREKDELKWGEFYAKYRANFLEKIQKYFIDYKIENREPIWVMMSYLNKLNSKSQAKVKTFIKKRFQYHLYETLRQERADMQTLLVALQVGIGNLMQEYFEKINFNTVLHALPAWIVNSVEVHKVLPLKTELFDVVIIDEATQCDIASSLPLLQRAKKAVIVGDPKQLRHISFLSKTKQLNLIKKHQVSEIPNHQLDYRKNSILDLVSASIPSQDQVHFLNEHYRSMPDIIDFSNQYFYASKLSIMTATPITLKETNVFIKYIEDGQKNKKGYNELEALAVISKAKSIIDKEAHLQKNLRQTIGILSPFRAQVTYLKSKIRTVISVQEIKNHQILIGTPHDFQGEERDVMLLSFTVDNETHPSTFIYLNKEDVFNVSITRARSLQYIFTSVNWNNLNPKYLFTQYLSDIAADAVKESDLSNYIEDDDFMDEVVETIKNWKVKEIYKSYPIAGLEIDIVVVHEEKTLCIDLVGYPGDFENIFPIDRWKMLSRVGVQTFTLPYSAWYSFPQYCKKYLKQFIFGK